MTTPLIRFGSSDALLCELGWGDVQSGTAAEVTRGRLRVEEPG